MCPTYLIINHPEDVAAFDRDYSPPIFFEAHPPPSQKHPACHLFYKTFIYYFSSLRMDCQGVQRGRCLVAGCSCRAFNSEAVRCDYCNHTPLQHEAEDQVSSPPLMPSNVFQWFSQFLGQQVLYK